MNKLIIIAMLALLTACEDGPDYVHELRAKHLENKKKKYSKEIRETAVECIKSVRQNPSVQNFNDDNEIVESCTEYALNLYDADDI